MYCPQCGTANNDDAAFCAKCGMDMQKYREQWSAPAAAGAAGEGNAGEQPGADQPGAGQPPEGQPGTGQQPTPPPPAYPPPYPQQYPPNYQTPSPYQPPYSAGGYQQPGYQPAGYQQPGYNYGTIPHVPSYLGWAIAVLILCFWPTGIVAVVYASKVGNRLAVGDVSAAQEASRKAKMWTWITFFIGVALAIIAVIGTCVAAGTALNNLN